MLIELTSFKWLLFTYFCPFVVWIGKTAPRDNLANQGYLHGTHIKMCIDIDDCHSFISYVCLIMIDTKLKRLLRLPKLFELILHIVFSLHYCVTAIHVVFIMDICHIFVLQQWLWSASIHFDILFAFSVRQVSCLYYWFVIGWITEKIIENTCMVKICSVLVVFLLFVWTEVILLVLCLLNNWLCCLSLCLCCFI